MPDTGSYSIVFKRIAGKVLRVNEGSGPSGLQQDRFRNVSFVLIRDVS